MRFISNRKTFYFVSGFLFLFSFAVFFFVPKNFGIDMTGGLQIEYSTNTPATPEVLEEVRLSLLEKYKFEGQKALTDVLIYTVNTDSIRMDIGLVAIDDVTNSQERTTDIRADIPKYFTEHNIAVTESKLVSVGQSFGKFVLDRAYLTIVVCLVGIALYLMYAFRQSIEGTSSMTFGVITLVTLLHDVIIAPGIFIFLGLFFPELKVDTFFVTAILTTLGFSINDTIVNLDRIRANYHDRKGSDKRSTHQMFEESIQVSLRRSLYTSLTILIILLCMLIAGPTSLVGFTTLMLLGTIVGTYSSICIAAPLLYDINSRKPQ